jgi:hypothetical protein
MQTLVFDGRQYLIEVINDHARQTLPPLSVLTATGVFVAADLPDVRSPKTGIGSASCTPKPVSTFEID